MTAIFVDNDANTIYNIDKLTVLSENEKSTLNDNNMEMTNDSVIELGNMSVQNNEDNEIESENDIESKNTERTNEHPNDFNIQSEIVEEESVDNTNNTIVENENIVH